jgi:uncharacterized metal-binding protein
VIPSLSGHHAKQNSVGCIFLQLPLVYSVGKVVISNFQKEMPATTDRKYGAQSGKEQWFMKSVPSFSLVVEGASGSCAVGEHRGNQCRAEGRIPVISCEGACIRGEIARLAANLVAKEEPYRRSCHGEMFTVPSSAIAEWMRESQKVVVIDGCFLHCHGRILKNLVAEEKIAQFDALAIYQKYTDLFDIDDVPEEERKLAARQVADNVLAAMECGQERE